MKTLLITGAEQGLGKAISEAAYSKYEVWHLPRHMLLSGKAAIDDFIQRAEATITHVVNNFGINHLSWIGLTEVADEEILRINVMNPYWVINALEHKQKTPCKVVNVGSITHRVPQRCTSLYCASKAALVQMTRVMARELAPEGWQINAFCPGKIEDTEMAELTDNQVSVLRGWTPEEADKYAKSLIPMGRYTDTKECAEAVLWLLEAPAYLNGACIDFAGGV